MDMEGHTVDSDNGQQPALSVMDWLLSAVSWFLSLSLTAWLGTAVGFLLLLVVWKSYKSADVFKEMGIPYEPPIPFIGNTLTIIKWGVKDMFHNYSKKHGKVYGMFFSGLGPALVVEDVDMLKEILVKQFHHFPNRSAKPQMDYKPWKYALTQLAGDHWKHVRSTLSPTFSTGKIKRMMPAIQNVSVNLKDHLTDVAAKGEMIELKEVCGRFSMDVIGAAAFGMDVSSIHNPSNDFVKHAYSLINPSKFTTFLFVMFPKLMGVLNRMGLLTSIKKSLDFFIGVTDLALKDRHNDTQKHHDFLQLLVESEREEGGSTAAVDSEINFKDQLTTTDQWDRKGLTMDEMQSNAFLFFLAGYETVSTTLSFTLFCLANNPQCLKEAQEEVDSKLGTKLVTYDLANELTYLEMCINEAMRMFPPGFILARCAAEEAEVCGLKIPKDMNVIVPVTELHSDPDLWPQPEVFDPWRHHGESRVERHPCSFLPFGLGPRNCIGMRLAQLEVRMGLATVLQHCTPLACDKTVYPPKVDKFRMRAVDELWVRLQKRE